MAPRDSKSTKPRVDLGEFGNSGLTRFGGYVYEERLPELQLYRGRKIYREMMDSDPVIAGVLRAIEMLIRQVKLRVQPADDAPEAAQDAEFVESCLDDMSMTLEDTLAEILTMLPFGWSLLEKVFKVRGGYSDDPTSGSNYSDGKIGWRKLAPRSQETLLRWEFDDSGGLRAMVQLPPPDYQLRYIPIEKALLFRTTSRLNNPEGYSILRGAFSSWYYKTNIQRIEAIGIERDLAGIPVVYAPPEIMSSNASADEQRVYATLKQIVTNLRRDEQEGVIMPNEYDEAGHRLYELSLLSTGGTRQFNTNESIQRYDHRMAASMLADFLLLGAGDTGSWALSSDKTNLFGTAIGSVLDSICSTINRFGIPQLLRLNGRDISRGTPKLMHGDIESPDLDALGNYVLRLSQAGAQLFPSVDGELEKYLMKAANLPEPADQHFSPLPNPGAQDQGDDTEEGEADSA